MIHLDTALYYVTSIKFEVNNRRNIIKNIYVYIIYVYY